jgi:argininosuccinate lyase
MCQELRDAGLTDELIVLAGETTGLTVALESPRRDRTFLTYLGVNANWSPGTIADDALVCDNLLLCDYFVAPLLRGEPARALLETARCRGVRTFFDTTWDPDGFPSETRAEIHELLPYVDVFLPNEVEACGLTGRSGDVTQAARDLQLVSSGWVVVTLGASGCFAVGPGGVELTVPASAIRVTDTTGAGDAFNAGLVRALARGAGWREALTTATRFATTVISRPSGQRWKRFVSTPV